MVAKSGAKSPKQPRETEVENNGAHLAPGQGVNQPPRRVYDAAFKLHVVRHALSLPENNRHKPIARFYPGLTPVQVRKWIRNKAALEEAVPTAKIIMHNDEPHGNAEAHQTIPDCFSHQQQAMLAATSQPMGDPMWGAMGQAQHRPAMMVAPNADVYNHLSPAFHQGPPMAAHLAHYPAPSSDVGHAGAPGVPGAPSSFHFMHSMPPPYYPGHPLHQPPHGPLYPQQGMSHHQGMSMGCLGAAPVLPLHPNVGCGSTGVYSHVAPPINSSCGMASAPMPCRPLDNTLPSQLLHGQAGFGGAMPQPSAMLPWGATGAAAEQSDDSIHKGKMRAALDLLNLCNGTGCSDESTAAVAPPLVM